MSETEQLLAHIQSFSAVHSQVPECLKQRVPLFAIHTRGGRKSRTGLQLNVRDGCSEAFASYWRPLLLLDTHVW